MKKYLVTFRFKSNTLFHFENDKTIEIFLNEASSTKDAFTYLYNTYGDTIDGIVSLKKIS